LLKHWTLPVSAALLVFAAQLGQGLGWHVWPAGWLAMILHTFQQYVSLLEVTTYDNDKQCVKMHSELLCGVFLVPQVESKLGWHKQLSAFLHTQRLLMRFSQQHEQHKQLSD